MLDSKINQFQTRGNLISKGVNYDIIPVKKTGYSCLAQHFFLQGCIVAALGGGAAAAKVGTDPRTAGTQVDDETLEFKVENAVEKDAQIKTEVV